jgi:hypothetical protein
MRRRLVVASELTGPLIARVAHADTFVTRNGRLAWHRDPVGSTSRPAGRRSPGGVVHTVPYRAERSRMRSSGA